MATGKIVQVIGTVVDVEFPPDEIWMAGDVGEGFKEMDSGSAHDDASNTPGMHETQTTDYAIVMEGEI